VGIEVVSDPVYFWRNIRDFFKIIATSFRKFLFSFVIFLNFRNDYILAYIWAWSFQNSFFPPPPPINQIVAPFQLCFVGCKKLKIMKLLILSLWILFIQVLSFCFYSFRYSWKINLITRFFPNSYHFWISVGKIRWSPRLSALNTDVSSGCAIRRDSVFVVWSLVSEIITNIY